MAKELLFSVSIKDCEVQTFRSGGKGGQNQNKVESGVRIIHHPSGARAESRETRDQLTNKRRAFIRLVEHPKFKLWHKLEVARRTGQPTLEDLVDRKMARIADFKFEERNEQGRWVTCSD